MEIICMKDFELPRQEHWFEVTFVHQCTTEITLYIDEFSTGLPLTIWEANVSKFGESERRALFISTDCDQRIKLKEQVENDDDETLAVIGDALTLLREGALDSYMCVVCWCYKRNKAYIELYR